MIVNLALWLIGAPAIFAAAGVLYQWIGDRRDRRRYVDPGRLVNIGNGCSLYLFEMGSGGPTIVFESGIAATNLNWRGLQQSVAEFTSTISYDRSGLGWSSRCHTPRTPANIAAELHALLQQTNAQPPYVLVGHSFGGLVVRRYALLYPDDVSAVVLVDPMRCEEWPPLDPSKQGELDRGKRLMRVALPVTRCGLARLALTSLFGRSGRLSGNLADMAGSGGRHVLSRVTTEVSKMPRSVWPVVVAHWSRPAFYAGMYSHIDSIPDTVTEMHGAPPIGNIPVLVLTPGKSTPLSNYDLHRIGDHARQVIAPASEHWIHLDEPELVIEAIREMMHAVAPESAVAMRK